MCVRYYHTLYLLCMSLYLVLCLLRHLITVTRKGVHVINTHDVLLCGYFPSQILYTLLHVLRKN